MCDRKLKDLMDAYAILYKLASDRAIRNKGFDPVSKLLIRAAARVNIEAERTLTAPPEDAAISQSIVSLDSRGSWWDRLRNWR